MAAIIATSWEGYNYLFDELVDQRTKDLPFVAKPYQGLILLGLYLMFIFKWGPKFMKNRPAYNIEKFLIFYNALQVAACGYLFLNALRIAWLRDYQWFCEPVDFSNSEKAIQITRFVYYYFLLKIVDLLDTVFFILRKKNNHVSFLHVYHHTGMVMLIWGAITYFPGGHGTLIGVINCFVHVVMYSYYLITVWNPRLKGLWWKKYITQLQILQFLWCVIHMAVIVFKTDCQYPRWTSAVFLPQNVFMLLLFVDFYIKEYIKKPKQQKKNREVNSMEENGKVKLESESNGKTHQH